MLRANQRFGKYKIERKLGEGGFGVVFQARDTIEGIRVALKMPYAHLISHEVLNDFRHEARVAVRLEHPNILPLKNADYIDGQFVIVTALGENTLEQRLQKRMSLEIGLSFAQQMLAATAFAHEHRIIHCDIKPDNLLVFPGNRLRLMDFGIARVAHKTLQGSGTGTVGYMAPEQAMGKPSFRSDVFSLGLVMYRIFSGKVPEWPFDWPPPGYARLKERLHPEMVALVQRAIQVDSRKRYRDAGAMQTAYQRIKSPRNPRSEGGGRSRRPKTALGNWKSVRRREFLRSFGKVLEVHQECTACHGPVSECMQACPWCGKARRKVTAERTRFSVQCPRCRRGLKSDWVYCPWCYGSGFDPTSHRTLNDRRYVARCDNAACGRKDLMPFMRYCPWCHRRVKKKWKIPGSPSKCSRCGWGILPSFWSYCPWCSKRAAK